MEPLRDSIWHSWASDFGKYFLRRSPQHDHTFNSRRRWLGFIQLHALSPVVEVMNHKTSVGLVSLQLLWWRES